MRQRVVNLAWWQALLLGCVAAGAFARELALPANAFWAFFVRYVVIATAATALLARLLPPHLTSEMPVRFMRARKCASAALTHRLSCACVGGAVPRGHSGAPRAAAKSEEQLSAVGQTGGAARKRIW
jgi:hypothetical protein